MIDRREHFQDHNRKRADIEEHEVNLKKEEDILESIRDSLKGTSYMRPVPEI